MEVLKRIHVLSLAKMEGIVMLVIGLLTSVLSAIYSLYSGIPHTFGLEFWVLQPLLSGVFGLISGAVAALLYNAFAKIVGGIKFDFEEE